MAGFSFGSFGANNAAPAASTSTAPTFSLTGSTAPAAGTTGQPAAGSSGFSFGSSTAQQPAASTSGAPAAGGGLFGGFGQQQPQQQPQQQQQQQPAAGQAGSTGGGLFGGSLFGAKPAASTTTTGTGLFGSTTQQQSGQQPQAGTTSLFGQPQPAQSTGLFGQPSTTQQPAAPAAGGLFKSALTQQQQLGASTSLFGGLGQSTTTQQQPGLQASTAQPAGSQSGLSKSTKFADLPEAHQKNIEQLDNWIKEQKAASAGIQVDALGRAIWQTTGSIKAAADEYAALSHGLVALDSALVQLRSRFAAEEEDLRKVAEIWETYKSSAIAGGGGQPGGVRIAAHRDFPHDFFSRLAAGMSERTKRYKSTIEQLERAVLSLSTSASGSGPHDGHSASASQLAVAQTIQNHQYAILNLAAHLENLQIRMNALRGSYAEEYRSRTGSMRDPFDVAREEKGISTVRI